MSKQLHSCAAWLAASLAACAAFAPATQAQTAATPPLSVTPAAPASTTPPTPQEESAYLLAYGWIVGQQAGVKVLGLTPAQIDQLAAGMKLALTTGPRDIPGGQDILPKMQNFLMARAEGVEKADAEKRTAATDKMLADLAKNPNVKKTASGLMYEIITPGAADKPKPENEVTVNYKGTLVDGTIFDESEGEPAKFVLNRVIPGWTEGMQLVGKGGKIKLYIPGNLGYGAEGAPGIPPNSLLVFDVELVDFGAAPAGPPPGLGGMTPEQAQEMLRQLQMQGGLPPGAGGP